MEIEHLNSAPIKEAIIEFQLNQKIDPEQLQELEGELPEGYADFKTSIRKELGIKFEDGKLVPQGESPEILTGYRSDNEQLKTVVFFETDKFRFSKLAPYTDWEDFVSEAFKLWNTYKPQDEPIQFKRIAIRYINELMLPLDEGKLDFDDYLTTTPKVPHGMPDVLARFLSKISVPCHEDQIMATVTLNSNQIQNGHLPIVLDIDVFSLGELTLSDKGLREKLNIIRDIKNKVFFGSITPKTKELFK